MTNHHVSTGLERLADKMMENKVAMQEIWDELFSQVQETSARAVGYWPGGLLLATVAHSQRPKLLIQFIDSPNAKTTLELDGLELELEQVEVDGAASRCLSLASREQRFDELFFPIVSYLVEHLNKLEPAENNLAAIEKMIQEWVAFFKEKIEKGSREAILGLIGELLALRDVIDLENAEAQFWQGPVGGIQDFRFPHDRLEVKVLGTRTGPRTHKISGIQQLVIPENGKLFLLSHRITLSAQGENSIHELVAEVGALSIFASGAGRKHFEESLKAVGYSEELVEKYSRFDQVDSILYQVTEDFPRLTPSMVSADSRVMDIRYSLDLSGLDDAEIDLSSEKLQLQ